MKIIKLAIVSVRGNLHDYHYEVIRCYVDTSDCEEFVPLRFSKGYVDFRVSASEYSQLPVDFWANLSVVLNG